MLHSSLSREGSLLKQRKLAVGALLLIFAVAAKAQVPVSACGVLNVPGETYLLTVDLAATGHCFHIAADNVTLDGQGHTISGNNTGWGVRVDSSSPVSNALISNLNTAGFDRGVVLAAGGGHSVINTHHDQTGTNGLGIYCGSSDGNAIVDNYSGFGEYGIFVDACSNTHLSGNEAADNNTYGIWSRLSSGNQLSGNTATGNGFIGILVTGSSDSTIGNNVLSGNLQGIGLRTSQRVVVSENSVSAPNVNIGLIDAVDNEILNNTVLGGGNGIRLQDNSANNLVSGNTINGAAIGVYLAPSATANDVVYNMISSASSSGIGLATSSDNDFIGNTIILSSWIAFNFSQGSHNNRALDNTLELNCRGVVIDGTSAGNQVFNNNFINNSVQAQVQGLAADNDFELAVPVGGNYWNDFDESSEGCDDSSPVDGQCDSAYNFTGDTDSIPWVEMNAWNGPGAGQANDFVIADPCIADNDYDNDLVTNVSDNCPLTPNPTQANNDGDTHGDVCDDDDDNDGIKDTADNCPFTHNPGQEDSNGDGMGDACTPDSDGDGVDDDVDQCPNTSPDDAIDPNGCSGGQLIELNCMPESFRNHGQYVACVTRWANEAARLGLISPQEKSGFVTVAAHTEH